MSTGRKRNKRIIIITSLLILLAAGGAVFFANGPHANEKDNPKWTYVCKGEGEAEVCSAEQALYMQKEVEGEQKNMGQILRINIYKGPESEEGEALPLFVMNLPLGVDLRAGVALKVDEEEEMKAPYAQCTRNGCEVRSALPKKIVEQFKKGKALHVGFRPFGTEQTAVMDVSLKGFSSALKKIM